MIYHKDLSFKYNEMNQFIVKIGQFKADYASAKKSSLPSPPAKVDRLVSSNVF